MCAGEKSAGIKGFIVFLPAAITPGEAGKLKTGAKWKIQSNSSCSVKIEKKIRSYFA